MRDEKRHFGEAQIEVGGTNSLLEEKESIYLFSEIVRWHLWIHNESGYEPGCVRGKIYVRGV